MTKSAFIEEVLPLKPIFFRFAYSLVKSIEVAEDVTQDVLIKIWQSSEKIENLKAWGMRLTRNGCLDKLKASSAKVVDLVNSMETPQNNLDPYEQSALNQSVELIKKAAQNLPEQQQLIWQLREIETCSYQEIADLLSITIDTVKVNLHRARKTLLTHLLNKEAYGY